MPRSTPHIDDGLELLLDTVCNMFGGILFLALLICLQYNSTSETLRSREHTDEGIEQILKLKQVQSYVSSLRETVADRQSRLTTQEQLLRSLGAQVDPALLGALQSLQLAEHELDASVAALRVRVAEAQRALRQSRDQLEQEDRRLQRNIEALVELRNKAQQALQQAANTAAELEERKAQQTVKLRLPRAHATTKRQIGVLLSSGRLRMPHKYDHGGNLIGINDDEVDFNVLDRSVSPADFIPNRGIVVSDDTVVAIDRRFAVFNPAAHYIIIVVWPDSFDAFRTLRDRLVERGFDYQLLLMKEDQAIHFGSDSPNEVQ